MSEKNIIIKGKFNTDKIPFVFMGIGITLAFFAIAYSGYVLIQKQVLYYLALLIIAGIMIMISGLIFGESFSILN